MSLSHSIGNIRMAREPYKNDLARSEISPRAMTQFEKGTQGPALTFISKSLSYKGDIDTSNGTRHSKFILVLDRRSHGATELVFPDVSNDDFRTKVGFKCVDGVPRLGLLPSKGCEFSPFYLTLITPYPLCFLFNDLKSRAYNGWKILYHRPSIESMSTSFLSS